MTPATVTASEAREKLPQIGSDVVSSGRPVTVYKNSKPWIVISPAAEPPLMLSSERDFWERIARAHDDVSQGRVREAAAIEDDLRSAYDLA